MIVPIQLRDPFVGRLVEDVRHLIEVDEAQDDASVLERLQELASTNNPVVGNYWRRFAGVGIPDTAFRSSPLFHFERADVVARFRTSGTSGRSPGVAEYSKLGLDLMRSSIAANARRHLFRGLDRPAVVRLVPTPEAAPEVVMAWGMAFLAEKFGDPGTSVCAIGPGGLDLAVLGDALDRTVAQDRPVVLIGGSFLFVHLCDALRARRKSWALPAGSRMLDAGGFKGRSRELDVDTLRASIREVFGIAPEACTNLFGMTELASQLYDRPGVGGPIGPKGQRTKASLPFIQVRARDPYSWAVTTSGPGVVEIVDLCIIDRPCIVLTGDGGIASPEGVAITGRIVASEARGCALQFESAPATAPSPVHAGSGANA